MTLECHRFLAWTVGLAKSFLIASSNSSFHSLAIECCDIPENEKLKIKDNKKVIRNSLILSNMLSEIIGKQGSKYMNNLNLIIIDA